MPLNSQVTSGRSDVTDIEAQIVIAGAGLAGLFTALKLAPLPVTVISPTPLGEGASSFWAQGGIAAAIGEGDHPDKHTADTIQVGGGIVDPEIASMVAYEASDRIRDLLSYGVPFDQDIEGKLALSREAAHSERRIVRVRGDMAGKAIMSALLQTVKQTPSITVIEGYRAERLITDNGRVCGIYLSSYSDNKAELRIKSPAVVVASGGVGGLYGVTTNPSTSSGEGLGMAALAGAVIADAEFVQFHPTALNVGIDPAPLATEALRGEGASLVNKNGKRFMPEYHGDAELAPRDIVARAVHEQVVSGQGAFLDCREAIGAAFPELYPTVYEKCMEAEVDPVVSPIPVAPAAHYHMGGILTDKDGRSSVPGLWACGEAASTGMHGANRLASNSLLEAVVFASRIADDLKASEIRQSASSLSNIVETQSVTASGNLSEVERKLRQSMARDLGVVREKAAMEVLLKELNEMLETYSGHNAFSNKLVAAKIMTVAAISRNESRGGHFRSDYPESDQTFMRRSYFKYNSHGTVEVTNIMDASASRKRA
ncbi:MAG: L-aspartate oxidase [Methyloligellaceae bacterium]